MSQGCGVKLVRPNHAVNALPAVARTALRGWRFAGAKPQPRKAAGYGKRYVP